MRFSIVICTYNSEKKLPKALDSILSQTFNDYEVVIVDGASTDRTLEVIKNYEKKFGEKLRWISEKDGGIYEAMNKGINLARGEWVYFLGSDDILFDREVLEKVVLEIKKEKILDVVYGDVMWGETGQRYAGKFSVLKLMQQNICHQAIFFKKNLFSRLGKFEVKYSKLADYVFNMRWFNEESVRRKYLDLIVANFALGGASSSSDEEFIQDKEKLIKEFFPREYFQLYKSLNEADNLVDLVREVHRLKEEIDFMKKSKFWKAREIYLKLKGN